MAERLIQTEQLVTQLKEMIREKDAALRSKDDQLKVRTISPPSSRGLHLVRCVEAVSVILNMLEHLTDVCCLYELIIVAKLLIVIYQS